MGRRQLRAADRRATGGRDRTRPRPAPSRVDGPGRKAEREIRWSMPDVSDDGKLAVASARSSDNKDRWYVDVDAETGKTRVVDTLHDDAWVREAGGGLRLVQRGVPAGQQARVVPVGARRLDAPLHAGRRRHVGEGEAADEREVGDRERVARARRKKFYFTSTEMHPGERHLYTVPIEGGARTKITSMTGSNVAEVSPDESTLGLVYSYSTKPPEVYVMPNTPGAAAKQITTTPTAEWRSFNWIDPKIITFKARDGVDVYARLFTPEMIGAKRDPDTSGRGVRPRRGLPAERAQVLVHLLPRVHVPQPAGLARLRRARRGLPRELGLRPRLADRDLPAHGRQGPRGHRRRREVHRREGAGQPEARSASTAAATAGSSR